MATADLAEDSLTPDLVVKQVRDHEQATELMRVRMETDYKWFRLEWTDERQASKADGYETYISNEPRTFADRMMAWLIEAPLSVRVPLEALKPPLRAAASMKERFIIGALARADDRLLAQVLPSLRSQLAFHICIRGWYSGRALLVKQPDGATEIDITPFDPLHVFWATGPHGLQWLIHRQMRMVDELEAEFGAEATENLTGGDHTTGIFVYDYYDGAVNGVCTEHSWLKRPQPHYSPRIPVFLGVVGAAPAVHRRDFGDQQDDWKAYGASIYDGGAREAAEQVNRTMSDMMTLVRRAVKPPIAITSRDGTKTLDRDPYADGSYISLRPEENVKALELLKMSLDTGPFLGQLMGELQRATIPHSSYGDLPFQLSGFALNTLRQSLAGALQPRVLAIGNCYKQISDLVCAQYETGGFAALELSGRDMNNSFFSTMFTPEHIKGAGRVEIGLAPKLPQDEMQRFTMAQIAREGKTPLLSDRRIRDEILRIQDVDAEIATIREELGETASPVALLLTLISALTARGREDLAAVYADDLNSLLQQKAMQQAAAMAGVPPQGEAPAPGARRPQPEVQPGGPPGLPPEVMPSAMMGVPPPAPFPQAGPLVPPGTPRPGAQGQPA